MDRINKMETYVTLNRENSKETYRTTASKHRLTEHNLAVEEDTDRPAAQRGDVVFLL